MSEDRFTDLMGRLLDENLTADELSELAALVRDDPSRQQELRLQLETAEMIAQAADELRQGPLFVATTLARIGDYSFVESVRSAVVQEESRQRGRHRLWWRWAWIPAAAVVIVLIAGVAWLLPGGNLAIARIAGLNGSVQWTGKDGLVGRELQVGESLGGGTLETLSADSWAVLEFSDGTSITVSGQAMLTMAAGRQKELHFRQGSLSASVASQPADKPMVIHTPTARVEVLGTQLNIDANPSSTILSVNEGRVRVTRLVDGSVTEVPAEHQVTASVDHSADLKVMRRPGPAHAWRSSLPADSRYGQWQPGVDGKEGCIRAAPHLVTCGQPKPLLVFVTSFAVSSGETSPVLLDGASKFRIQGRMSSSADVYFGLTMHYPKGGFAGKYVASRPVQVSGKDGGSFELELRLDDFKPLEDKFPRAPTDLELKDCWCLTLHEDRGLSISRVELIPLKR